MREGEKGLTHWYVSGGWGGGKGGIFSRGKQKCGKTSVKRNFKLSHLNI